MCVIPQRCCICGTMSLHWCRFIGVVVLWHHGAIASWSCDAMLVWCWSSSTVRLHDLEVGYGCLHRQRSCGNVLAHSVFKGMNTVAVPLPFNYVDRSWAMGVEKFFCFLLRIPTMTFMPSCFHLMAPLREDATGTSADWMIAAGAGAAA
jgi:hypothetical protein